MSWSIGAKGTKEEVVNQIKVQAENSAALYKGQPEADDVIAARDRILALVDAVKLGDHGYGTTYDGVSASAYGSHSPVFENGVASGAIVSGSFSVNVSAVKL